MSLILHYSTCLNFVGYFIENFTHSHKIQGLNAKRPAPDLFWEFPNMLYTVPVTRTVAVPGVTVYAPVIGSCENVAAGTVILPGTVANSPVASS